jgi:hypothetical protein
MRVNERASKGIDAFRVLKPEQARPDSGSGLMALRLRAIAQVGKRCGVIVRIEVYR